MPRKKKEVSGVDEEDVGKVGVKDHVYIASSARTVTLRKAGKRVVDDGMGGYTSSQTSYAVVARFLPVAGKNGKRGRGLFAVTKQFCEECGITIAECVELVEDTVKGFGTGYFKLDKGEEVPDDSTVSRTTSGIKTTGSEAA